MDASNAELQKALYALRTSSAAIMEEKKRLQQELEEWDAKLLDKKELLAELENTAKELRKPDGKRQGLIRCTAEYTAAKEAALNPKLDIPESQSFVAKDSDGGLAFEVSCRLADALAKGPHTETPPPPLDHDFEKLFRIEGDGPVEQFLAKLNAEQRLFWELQNPIEHTENWDRQLWNDLKALGRSIEADLLASVTGQPTLKEMQYRALLWMRKHDDLNVSYVEPACSDTSLLILACQRGFDTVASELVRRGADVHHISASKVSALMAACACGSRECVRLLLENGANANQDVDGQRALLIAAGMQSQARDTLPGFEVTPMPASVASFFIRGPGLVPLLLEFDADPNTAASDGSTPLIFLAERGELSVCQQLLSARADPQTRNGLGKTACDMAMKAGHEELGAVLHAAG